MTKHQRAKDLLLMFLNNVNSCRGAESDVNARDLFRNTLSREIELYQGTAASQSDHQDHLVLMCDEIIFLYNLHEQNPSDSKTSRSLLDTVLGLNYIEPFKSQEVGMSREETNADYFAQCDDRATPHDVALGGESASHE
jgi:hypothetical protein